MDLPEALGTWNPWWHDGSVPGPLTGRPRELVPDLLADMEGPRAVVLTGIRRSGKTTLMYQMIEELIRQGVDPGRLLYINLEDLALDDVSLDEITAAHRQAFAPAAPRYLFFDEVQTRPEWARFVRVIVDQKRDRIAVTGSTSALLAGEAGALLTGRHRATQVRPLDFRGFLEFHDVKPPPRLVPSGDADLYLHWMDRYLRIGGFPEPNVEDPATARRTLQHYFTDILQRDLVASRDLDPLKVRTLGGYLAKTFARPHSKRGIQQATGLSRTAIREYVDALESAYVISTCSRFTWSPKPEVAQQSPVKYYLADPGLRNAVVTPGRDEGRLAENAAANALEARGHPLCYWKGSRHEVDFVVPRRGGDLEALQVTYGSEVPDREAAALVAFRDEIPRSRAAKLTILTRHEEGAADGIQRIPLWKWLLMEGPQGGLFG